MPIVATLPRMSKSNVVAIALAGLAVVMAATGTAVAVTATQVNIADPITPSRVARVDSAGRLTTVDALSAYTYSSLLSGVNSQDNFITAPTTATLGLTSLALSHPNIVSGTANTELRVVLYKENSSSSSSCTSTRYQQLYAWNLKPGDNVAANLTTPTLVKATGATPYCLSLYAYPITGGTYGANYYPYGSATWYVVSGTYNGPGMAGSAKTPAQVRRDAKTHTDR